MARPAPKKRPLKEQLTDESEPRSDAVAWGGPGAGSARSMAIGKKVVDTALGGAGLGMTIKGIADKFKGKPKSSGLQKELDDYSSTHKVGQYGVKDKDPIQDGPTRDAIDKAWRSRRK